MPDPVTLPEYCDDPCPPCCDGDIDEDCAQILMEDAMRNYDSSMAEIDGNEEATRMVVAASGATKFHEVGPLEAVATEVILRGVRKITA